MAGKSDFTDAEWAKVLSAPLLAGVAVTCAEPSGLFGMLKEGFASGKALLDARKDASAGELEKAVATAFEDGGERSQAREALAAAVAGKTAPADIRDAAIAALRAVGALVDAKAPGDAPGFKAWLRSVAQRVAESASEGGFLGFGGVTVSEAEKATLGDVAAALNLPA
ncbi:hypothetical protein [Methylocella sp.]|uniref:hypothetical protein n=1 Tax=Methylocella sp. TaxID=1978226 RepID=UPI0035B3AFC2